MIQLEVSAEKIAAMRETAERVKAVTAPSTHAHALALSVLHLIDPVRPRPLPRTELALRAIEYPDHPCWAITHIGRPCGPDCLAFL